MSAKLQTLIRQLFTAEDMAHYEADFLAYGERATGPLLEVFENRSYWDEDAPGGGVAPAKAARLLGRLRAPEAVDPMIVALEVLDPLDILYSAVISALSEYGEAVAETILDEARAVREANADFHQALVEILVNIGTRDPRILDELRAVLRHTPDLGAALISTYGDPAAIPDLREALERDHGDGSRAEQIEVEVLAALAALGAPAEPRRRAVPPAKPGRNAPCWCGSGRKYKACHERTDRA